MRSGYAFLAGLVLFEIIADVFAKKFGIASQARWFFLSLLAYIIANTSWLIYMAKDNNLAIGANIFSVSTGVIAAAIGVSFYNEAISSKQIVGMLLGVCSLWLLMGK